MLVESGFATQSELRKTISTAISGPNALAIRVSRRYNTAASLFQDAARLAKIEEILSRLVGQPSRIRIDWIDEPAETAPIEGKTSTAVAQGQQRQQRAELMKVPLVKLASEILGAQIVRADEGFGIAAKKSSAEEELESETEETLPEDE